MTSTPKPRACRYCAERIWEHDHDGRIEWCSEHSPTNVCRLHASGHSPQSVPCLICGDDDHTTTEHSPRIAALPADPGSQAGDQCEESKEAPHD